MPAIPVTAVIDVGKTNKKIFLFNKDYEIVYELSVLLNQTVDEDGDPCEDIDSLRLWMFDSLRSVFKKKDFIVKAINFSSYGASFVYVDEKGNSLTPLYNYLKPYPEKLKQRFYDSYGGEEQFSILTASPVLGSLNSGMQLYRLKNENPDIFGQTRYALHLPQYLSFLLTGTPFSDVTSIGCHTNLWNFQRNEYHHWVKNEGIEIKLAPIARYDDVETTSVLGNTCDVGIGLHDSSAALNPYLISFQEPFVLISTGTWNITLHPFNVSPLTAEELKQDCLCYLQFEGKPVKAARFFAGIEYEKGLESIAVHFNQDVRKFNSINFDPKIIAALHRKETTQENNHIVTSFSARNLAAYNNDLEAYHRLMLDMVNQQVTSTNLVLKNAPVKRLFVDGGFSQNTVFMNLLALAFPHIEIYAASVAQSTALGAAIAIHNSLSPDTLPGDLIQLQHYKPLS